MKLETSNGVYFVKSNKELVNSLFTGPKTASGTYKVEKHSILFYNMKGEPIACLCAHDRYSRFFVTTCYNNPPEDKRIRYMFGLADYTRNELGLNGMRHIEESDLARDIWNKFKTA